MAIRNEVDFLGKIRRYVFRDSHLENVFRRREGKRVLLSYITAPFISEVDKRHTNSVETIEIAKVFDELGYIVDVYDYTYKNNIDYARYDVVFGFEWPLINSFYCEKKIKRIMYGTGRHPYVSGPLSLKRIREMFNYSGILMLKSARLVDIDYASQTSLVDGIICLGDKLCKDSWTINFPSDKVFNVPPTFYKVLNFDKLLSDPKIIRKNYLWFGSSGLVHKGLDLVLRAFNHFPDLDLYVCGPVGKESRFANVFNKELFQTKNIHCLDFIDIRSEEFENIMRKCGNVIFPSCSEGGSPSVATVVGNGGLLPIITKETTLDLGGNAIYIKDFSVKSVVESINESQKMSDDEYWNMSINAQKYIDKNCTIDRFHSSIKNAILTILK